MGIEAPHIKNPLSIIAIFAGIAEVFGTIVLPHLDAEVQKTFIWFLMTFPFFLVFLFFITLNYNHRVLYAPSDYKNEDFFMEGVRQANPSHVEDKREHELQEAQETSISEDQLGKDFVNNNDDEIPIATEKPSEEGDQLPRSTTTTPNPPKHGTLKNSLDQYEMIESWILSRFQRENSAPILRNVKIASKSDYIFDGISNDGKSTTIYEVKSILNSTRETIIEKWATELNIAISDSIISGSLKGEINLVVAFVNFDGSTSELKKDSIIRLFKNNVGSIPVTFAFISIDDFRSLSGN